MRHHLEAALGRPRALRLKARKRADGFQAGACEFISLFAPPFSKAADEVAFLYPAAREGPGFVAGNRFLGAFGIGVNKTLEKNGGRELAFVVKEERLQDGNRLRARVGGKKPPDRALPELAVVFYQRADGNASGMESKGSSGGV